MLKNKANVLPLAKIKQFTFQRNSPRQEEISWVWRFLKNQMFSVSIDIVKKYFNVTEKPEEVDFALVFVSSPNSGIGYNSEDAKKGGNGYVPISLQYGEYTVKKPAM